MSEAVAERSTKTTQDIWTSFVNFFQDWMFNEDELFSRLDVVVELVAASRMSKRNHCRIVKAFLEGVVIDGATESWCELSYDKFAGLLVKLDGIEIAREMFELAPRQTRARVVLHQLSGQLPSNIGGW